VQIPGHVTRRLAIVLDVLAPGRVLPCGQERSLERRREALIGLDLPVRLGPVRAHVAGAGVDDVVDVLTAALDPVDEHPHVGPTIGVTHRQDLDPAHRSCPLGVRS
jgi:hypothetical protein